MRSEQRRKPEGGKRCIIARKAGFTACGVRSTIQLNGADFYRLACGERISFKVPADNEIEISCTSMVIPDRVLLEPEKDKHYYFGNDCNPFACWFHQISKGEHKKIVATCGTEKIVE